MKLHFILVAIYLYWFITQTLFFLLFLGLQLFREVKLPLLIVESVPTLANIYFLISRSGKERILPEKLARCAFAYRSLKQPVSWVLD